MANNDLNNAPNTDQDINNTATDRPDQYATRYRGSNPDLDVADNAGTTGDTGKDDRGVSGSTGNIGATAYGTYNAPNDQTGASNTSTGGVDDTATANADAGTPVMQPGGARASADVISSNPGTGADVNRVPQARTDTTLDENYSTGPRRTDPEQELLNPGYDPQSDRNTMGPNRAGDRVSPGIPGLPDQRGTLDQTTYTSEDGNPGTDAGTEAGAGLP